MSGKGERVRVAIVIDARGTPQTHRISEPDVECARKFDEQAHGLRMSHGLNGHSEMTAERLEALADVCRVAAATQLRFPALRVP